MGGSALAKFVPVAVAQVTVEVSAFCTRGKLGKTFPFGCLCQSMGGSVIVIVMTALCFHMLVDPVQNDVGDFEVVLVLHEHVAVAKQSNGRQGDKCHVSARGIDLLHLGRARG